MATVPAWESGFVTEQATKISITKSFELCKLLFFIVHADIPNQQDMNIGYFCYNG